jgi:tetratricopeptide (TPR) repeat protein
MTVTRSFYLIALLLAVNLCQAQTATLTAGDVRSLLSRGEFGKLDGHFGQLQRSYGAGRITEVDLRAAFRVFYEPDPVLESAYSRWVANSPQSYVAHLARGIYYKFLGTERRGEESASRTTPEQFAAMHAAHRIAASEFERSIKLEKKPILSYLHYIDILMYKGDDAGTRRLFENGLKLDSKTFVLREKYLGTLMRKWGGTPEQMHAFIAESRLAGLTQQQMAQLNSVVIQDEAWVRQFHDQDDDGAINLYRRAALLSGEACASCSADASLAELLAHKKQFSEALLPVSRVLKARPDDIEMLNLRAFCYLELGQGAEATPDLERGAALGSAWSQTELAKVLLNRNHFPDRARAVRLLERAASQNYEEAMSLLTVTANPNFIPKSQP